MPIRSLEQLSTQFVELWGPRAQEIVDEGSSLAAWARTPGEQVAFVAANDAAREAERTGGQRVRDLVAGVTQLLRGSDEPTRAGVRELWIAQSEADDRLASSIAGYVRPRGMYRPASPSAAQVLLGAAPGGSPHARFIPVGSRLVLGSQVLPSEQVDQRLARISAGYVIGHEASHGRQLEAARRVGGRQDMEAIMPLVEAGADEHSRSLDEVRRAAGAFGVHDVEPSDLDQLRNSYQHNRAGLQALFERLGIDGGSPEVRAMLADDPRALHGMIVERLMADPAVTKRAANALVADTLSLGEIRSTR